MKMNSLGAAALASIAALSLLAGCNRNDKTPAAYAPANTSTNAPAATSTNNPDAATAPSSFGSTKAIQSETPAPTAGSATTSDAGSSANSSKAVSQP